MTDVTNFGTTNRTSEVDNQNQQPFMQSPRPKPIVETDMPTILVPTSSTAQDIQNKSLKLAEKISNTQMSDKRFPAKKLSKTERINKLNARMRRLVSPKSPLMVFYELFRGTPIQLQADPSPNSMNYIATLEMDGQLYTGSHVSKVQAKQKACENFLRFMLSKKIREQSEEEEGSSNNIGMKYAENNIVAKSIGQPQDDFPWPEFASIAMHKLFKQWEIMAVPNASLFNEKSNFIKSTPKDQLKRKRVASQQSNTFGNLISMQE